jgi:hypothetical protein
MSLPIIRLRLPIPIDARNAVVGEAALLGVVPRPDRKLLSVRIAELLACRSIVGNTHLNAGDVALVTRFARLDGIDTIHGKPRIVSGDRAHRCNQKEMNPHGRIY